MEDINELFKNINFEIEKTFENYMNEKNALIEEFNLEIKNIIEYSVEVNSIIDEEINEENKLKEEYNKVKEQCQNASSNFYDFTKQNFGFESK